MEKLLTRTEFREQVFSHNGATLCAGHHLQAEETTLSCEEVRQAADITRVVLPSHLYDDARYDK